MPPLYTEKTRCALTLPEIITSAAAAARTHSVAAAAAVVVVLLAEARAVATTRLDAEASVADAFKDGHHGNA